jgi:hypothetical protein
MELCRPIEKGDHFAVTKLRKRSVVGADGREVFGGMQADDLVNGAAKPADNVARRDGNREQKMCRVAPARRPQCGKHRRTGGDPIIDDDNGPARHRHWRPTLEIDGSAPLKLRNFGGFCILDIVAGYSQSGDQLFIQHQFGTIAVGDSADRELRLSRRADLADQDQIQRGPQHAGDFETDGNATARQGQYDRVSSSPRVETRREPPAGIRSVAEEHRNLLFRPAVARLGLRIVTN